jgi:beta-lactamase class A
MQIGLEGGGRYAVYAAKVDGSDVISVNAEEVYLTASIYKLFVAYSMMRAVDEGKATWSTALNGMMLEVCFEKMIEISDNECAEAWIRRVGERTINNEIQALGVLKNTKFTGVNNATTAEDVANFLSVLYDRWQFPSELMDKLVGSMTINRYRDGIPAGVGDAASVANKVGFLGGLLHDAAIVFPKDEEREPYVLVVLTQGKSWRTIADISRVVELYYASK